jgi:hypothetical protein
MHKTTNCVAQFRYGKYNFLSVMAENKALRGLRVLEYSDFIAGPYCAKLLGDLGAEVIKIEKPNLGDDSRLHGPSRKTYPTLRRAASSSISMPTNWASRWTWNRPPELPY